MIQRALDPEALKAMAELLDASGVDVARAKAEEVERRSRERWERIGAEDERNRHERRRAAAIARLEGR